MFDISEYSIQCNADSSCEHMTSGVNIYLNRYVNILAPECACVYVCVCDVKSGYQQKTGLCGVRHL